MYRHHELELKNFARPDRTQSFIQGSFIKAVNKKNQLINAVDDLRSRFQLPNLG